MSTRTQIMVEGQPCKLYKHSDGYPSEVVPVLFPFIQHFMQHRGWDECYMSARLVEAFAIQNSQELVEYTEFCKRQNREPDKQNALIGLGIDCEWHDDLEWVYVIRRATIDVYQPSSITTENTPLYLDPQGIEATIECAAAKTENDTYISVVKRDSFPHIAHPKQVVDQLG